MRILLVEDNPGDVRLTLEGLRESKVRNNLRVARDGVEAMAFRCRMSEAEIALDRAVLIVG